ncbi:uncharacterized protein DUF3560 [Haloactinopolyspora alba]|uniref:Uncharacterized protein DUF3560 n=1 Tax=Haloactinopolyspora alba TaxID=648780 RepID=A0A2P8DF36_9ACTN|nr:DUF3560 domain-containing protein [Haloactinopolyspora alba]PSK95835.1 uncharacterized protein DUF3560 [Haloactinopolyspora alba]
MSDTTTTSTPWIEHTGDGTLVHDTDRDDTELRQALKATGFRWSRSLDAWHLPRPWTFNTRTLRVRQLVDALDKLSRTIRVEESRERTRTSAEIEAERTARAEARAERLDARADRRAAEAETTDASARAALDGWPLGQPLVGSPTKMRAQRNFLDREHRKMQRAAQLDSEATTARQGAATARTTAARNESPGVIARRLKRLEADRRRVTRRIDGTDGPWSEPATGDRLVILQTEAADLDEQIAWNRDALAAAETARGRLWGPADFRVGDEARIGGRWYPVRRVNRKTVTVPPLMDLGADAGRSWTDTVPYDEVRGRRRDGVETATPDDAEEQN